MRTLARILRVTFPVRVDGPSVRDLIADAPGARHATRLGPAAARARMAVTTAFRDPTVSLGLAGLLILAVAVRLAVVDRSFWIDETITALKADQGLGDMLRTLVLDVHPPLYYLLVHEWAQVFGISELSLRGLSVCWSILAVIAVWAWSREAFPDRSAFPAAALAAVGPFSVWYGSEARPYAQLLALTAVAGWLTWRVLARGGSPARLCALLAAFIGVLYTHYMGALFVGTAGLIALVLAATRRDLRRTALGVTGAGAVAAASLVPWLAWVLANRPAAPKTTDYPVPDLFSAFIAGTEMLVGFNSYDMLGMLAAGWPLLCVAVILAMPRLGLVRWGVAGLLALVLLPPALLIAVSLYVQPVFDPRFLTVCAAPLFLVVGAAASALRPRAWRVSALAALVTVGTALSVWQAHNPLNPKMYQLRESIAAANALSRPGDVLLMVPHLNTAVRGQTTTDPVTAYYRPRQSLRLLNASSAGALTRPEVVWKSVRRARPRRAFIIFGFESARGLAAGASFSARYQDFFGKRATGVRTHRFTNVVLRVYTFDWGGVR